MAIDKNSSEVITLEQAIDYTHAFQENNPDTIKSFFVGVNKINRILEQENCIGIRAYNGYDNVQNTNNLVLVGVDVNGQDMTEGVILERLITCPPDCAKSSPLINS